MDTFQEQEFLKYQRKYRNNQLNKKNRRLPMVLISVAVLVISAGIQGGIV